MPKRTSGHVVAEKALTAVASAVAEAGHAVETITNDYGEDLLVQTSYENRMDASRLWFQVKGTEDASRYRLKGGEFSLAVGFEHALRWARSADLVVVVLWDVAQGKGWYTIPKWQVETWADLASETRASLKLYFSPECEFTLEAISRLVWESRIDHHRMLLLSAHDIEQGEEHANASELRAVIVMDLMRMLGMIEPAQTSGKYRLTIHVTEVFFVACRRLLDDYECESEDVMEMAALWTVIDQMHEIDSKLGLPRVLASDMRDILLALVPPFGSPIGQPDGA